MAIIRTHLLDTSALIKLVVVEEGSDTIRSYKSIGSVFWTTSFCFAEALGVLKSKYFFRKEISKDHYLASTYDLVSQLRNHSFSIQEVDIADFEVFNTVENLAKVYNLDIADSFQLATLKIGFQSTLVGESKTILITADEGLEIAGTKEGLRVWNILKSKMPV